MGRRRPSAGLTEEMVLACLSRADDQFAARALRRHDAWLHAVETGASARTRRMLHRAWERARDEALISLSARETQARGDRSTRPHPGTR